MSKRRHESRSESKVTKKLADIISDWLETNEYPWLGQQYERLLSVLDDHDAVMVQLVMALMCEVADNGTNELDVSRFQQLLRQLPAEHSDDLA